MTAPARRDFAGGAVPTTITGALLSTTLTIPIADATGWPVGTNGKFYVAIDYGDGNTKQEKVLVTSRSGLALTVASTADRGVDGTTAQTHASGATITHCGTAADLEEANAHHADVTRDDHTQYMRKAQNLADLANVGTARTNLGLVIGTNVQAFDADLSALAALASAADKLPYFTGAQSAALTTLTSFIRTLLDDVDAATARATLGLTIGTNVQAYDAELAALAGLTSAADKLPYFTGSGTAGLADLTTAGRALIDDASAAAQRTTLGLGAASLLAVSDLFEVQQAVASGSTTVSAVGNPAATPTSVAGTTITVTPPRTGCVYVLHGTADVTYTGGGGGSDLQAAVTALSIDNSNTLTSPQIIGFGKIAAIDFRVTLHQTWVVTQAQLGDLLAHTLRLKAYKLSAGDTVVLNQSHTQLTCTRFG